MQTAKGSDLVCQCEWEFSPTFGIDRAACRLATLRLVVVRPDRTVQHHVESYTQYDYAEVGAAMGWQLNSEARPCRLQS